MKDVVLKVRRSCSCWLEDQRVWVKEEIWQPIGQDAVAKLELEACLLDWHCGRPGEHSVMPKSENRTWKEVRRKD